MAKTKGFDVVVVGGGPSGLTAAYHAAKADVRVLLIDRQPEPGEKILLSGGGRCNILPIDVDPSRFVTDSSSNTLKKILRSWPIGEIREFLEGPLGIRLVEQKRTGKVFPATGGGEEVRKRFLQAVRRAGAIVRTNAKLVDILPSERRKVVLESGEAIVAGQVVLATGGLSYPKTGSDGSGLEVARRLGHSIVEPYPALAPLMGGTEAHHSLSGISLPVRLTIGQGKGRVRSVGDFLFTYRGYSGPVVLNAAHVAGRFLNMDPLPRVSVAWLDRTEDDWAPLLSPGPRTVRGVLKEELPDRLVEVLLDELDLQEEKLSTLRREDRNRLLAALTDYALPWRRMAGFKEAEVTGGGIPLSEIDPKTLQSRTVSCVHFCGEILDAFGPIGGNNFLWAFVTGKLAGVAAAELSA